MFCLSARIKTCSSGRSRSLRFKLIRKMMTIIMIMKKMMMMIMRKMIMMMMMIRMIRMISHEQQQIENGNRWERLEWNDIA